MSKDPNAFADQCYEEAKAQLVLGLDGKTLEAPAEHFLDGTLKGRVRAILARNGDAQWDKDRAMVLLGAWVIGTKASRAAGNSSTVNVQTLREAGQEVFQSLRIPSDVPPYS